MDRYSLIWGGELSDTGNEILKEVDLAGRFELERFCRELMENAVDGVIFSDAEGKILFWNRGSERIFGYSRDEAIGKTLDIIIPEKLRERHWDGYRKAMKMGEVRYGDTFLSVPALKKGGGRISIEFSVVLVRDDDGHVAGVGAIVRDVTERYLKEKELVRRIEECEKERRRD